MTSQNTTAPTTPSTAWAKWTHPRLIQLRQLVQYGAFFDQGIWLDDNSDKRFHPAIHRLIKRPERISWKASPQQLVEKLFSPEPLDYDEGFAIDKYMNRVHSGLERPPFAVDRPAWPVDYEEMGFQMEDDESRVTEQEAREMEDRSGKWMPWKKPRGPVSVSDSESESEPEPPQFGQSTRGRLIRGRRAPSFQAEEAANVLVGLSRIADSEATISAPSSREKTLSPFSPAPRKKKRSIKISGWGYHVRGLLLQQLQQLQQQLQERLRESESSASSTTVSASETPSPGQQEVTDPTSPPPPRAPAPVAGTKRKRAANDCEHGRNSQDCSDCFRQRNSCEHGNPKRRCRVCIPMHFDDNGDLEIGHRQL